MKPALLYLKRYIQENYNNGRFDPSSQKDQKITKNIHKNSQESIFCLKKNHQWQNQLKKEFYFKVPKSFSALKQKRMRLSQTHKAKRDEQSRNSTKNKIEENQKKDTIQTNSMKLSLNNDSLESNKQNQDSKIQEKSVKFIISPPIVTFDEGTQKSSQNMNQAEENPCQIFPQENQQSVTQKNTQSQEPDLSQPRQQLYPKLDHSRIACKSMKKVGYNNLLEYLQEMQRWQNIKKKQIKQAHYYPMACMTPQIDEVEHYQQITKYQKSLFSQKQHRLSTLLQIKQNFTPQQIQFQHSTPVKRHKKQSSNFSKSPKGRFDNEKAQNNQKDDEGLKKKILLQYEAITIVNCQNKNYFEYKIEPSIDYTSFFKYTTPLLDSKPEKDNNYLLSKDIQEKQIGLYFCCLINKTLHVRQTFFWVRKPIQFYKKPKLISRVDEFLLEIKGFNLLQNQKIWVIDFHGRNSFIHKKLLTRCNQQAKLTQSVNITSGKKDRMRCSKRISLNISQQLLGSGDAPQSYFGMLANLSEFGQSLFLKKQRNNISTRGNFKLIHQPTQITS